MTPPASLTDLAAWLQYRSSNHLAALPQEARIFYRRGLLLKQAGSDEEAVEQIRGASDLDPDLVAPHLTLAAWFLLREPSQALLQYAAVLEMVRQSFTLQLALVANTIVLAVQALFLGFLAAALLLVWIRNAELRHAWEERLIHVVGAGGARVWAWSFLVLPFAVGAGLALPAVVLLGISWPSLKLRERFVFVALVAMLGSAPWITSALDRLSVPMRPDQAPIYGTAALASEGYSVERDHELAVFAAAHPGNPFLEFSLAWELRRAGDLRGAEQAYRRSLALWPGNDHVMNNLGNTLASLGRQDEALEMYARAYAANPRNGTAYFNASQIFTQRFEYRAATDALSRASALNFELLREYQSRATADGRLPLADQWLDSKTYWTALAGLPMARPGRGVLPPAWRTRQECSGWLFSALCVLFALAGVGFGIRQHRRMPLRNCSNCGAVVCRRCAQRRRETALCLACAAVESRADSPEFARVLLRQHHRSVEQRRDLVRTALATLIPGYGLLSLQRALLPLALLIGSAALASPWLGLAAPFTFEPRVPVSAGEVPVPLLVGAWAAVYALSLLGYFTRLARTRAQAASLAAPTRSRVTQSTHRDHAAAA
ncbi:MAG: tetratricopeptide repeat protein [Candidatus Eisenbacteria bacterium]|nr:tetratricopeptide repeat protein [Candidatus Eisenbacteria bacterium]